MCLPPSPVTVSAGRSRTLHLARTKRLRGTLAKGVDGAGNGPHPRPRPCMILLSCYSSITYVYVLFIVTHRLYAATVELGKLTAARMQHVDRAWGSSKDPAAELKKSSVIGLADIRAKSECLKAVCGLLLAQRPALHRKRHHHRPYEAELRSDGPSRRCVRWQALAPDDRPAETGQQVHQEHGQG